MKSKSPLALMEVLAMILIFSIAAALCIQIFVTADRWSRENEIKDRAVLSVQTVAETLKAVDGELEKGSDLLGGMVSGQTWTMYFDGDGQIVAKSGEAVYDIIVEKTSSGQELLGTASVTARTLPEKNELFCITAAWQEVGRDE